MNAPLKRDDLLDAYKAASQFDPSKPAPATQDAILSYAARAAKAANISAHIASSAEAQNDRSWRITGTRALGGLMMIGVVGMLVMRMFPDLQKQQALEAPRGVTAKQDAAPVPEAAGESKAKNNNVTATTDSPAKIAKTVQGELKSQTQALGASANTSVAGSAALPAPVEQPAAVTAAIAAPERMVRRAEEKNKLEAGQDAAMATTSAITAKSTADTREMPTAAKRMASPPVAMPAPAAAPAAPTAPSAIASPMGMAFPVSALNPSEQLLALINDERGACKTAPNLDAVRRLLAHGANPNFDKFPFGDHGTITRRAQLCEFREVVRMLETKP